MTTTSKPIDFVIVGAQKSGTTSLHEVLNRHPQISMPPSKEAPIFNKPYNDLNELRNDVESLFAGVTHQSVLKGKASPQYLPSTIAREQIFQLNPKTKIIAILRDPVERSLSHYRMLARRGQTNLSFPATVSALLTADHSILSNKSMANSTLNTTHSEQFEVPYILAWSEYARMLKPYIDTFTEENVLILRTEDLKEKPYATYKAILKFLDLDENWTHPSMNQVFHRGGDTPIINFKRLRHVPILGATLKAIFNVLPERAKYLINTRNIKSSNVSARKQFPQIAQQLDMYFHDDQAQVQSLFASQDTR